jgi:hypothetical protein
MGSVLLPNMKEKRLSLRLSEKRMYALQVYAASKEKSITAVIEDWIDSTRQEMVHSSSTNIPD